MSALESVWPKLRGALRAEADVFDARLAELGPERFERDPLRLVEAGVDLLGIVGRPRAEVSHTQAIASLCRASIEQGDGGLVRALVSAASQEWAHGLVAHDVSSTWRPEPEKTRAWNGKTLIPDLVLVLGHDRVVLENKVGVKDRDRQLDDYADWARALVSPGDRPPLLVYLTPDGSEPVAAARPRDWVLLSYRALVEAWRAELDRLRAPWDGALRLYLASALRHVVGLTWPPQGFAEKARLVGYLDAALAAGRKK